jgi:hypothetical protein
MTPSPEEDTYNENRTHKSYPQLRLYENPFTKRNGNSFEPSQSNIDNNFIHDKSMENFQLGSAQFPYVSAINQSYAPDDQVNFSTYGSY